MKTDFGAFGGSSKIVKRIKFNDFQVFDVAVFQRGHLMIALFCIGHSIAFCEFDIAFTNVS